MKRSVWRLRHCWTNIYLFGAMVLDYRTGFLCPHINFDHFVTFFVRIRNPFSFSAEYGIIG